MPLTRVSPKQAHELITNDGYAYVDVRSVPEYERGHAPGAYNIPLMHMGPGGMSPNPEFAAVFQKAFPDKDAKIVCACKAGGRSTRAAEIMIAAGYKQIVDMRGGWGGDGTEPGWSQVGLPTELETPGKTWNDLKK